MAADLSLGLTLPQRGALFGATTPGQLIDLARWALGKATVAPSVMSVGGRLGYDDDGQTPNTIFAVHDYGDCQLVAEVRGLPAQAGGGNRMDQYRGIELGNVVECEGGYITIDEQRAIAFDKNDAEIRRFTGEAVTRDRSHMANLGRHLFSEHLISVEVAGTLLLVALVGAVAIAIQGKPRLATRIEEALR